MYNPRWPHTFTIIGASLDEDGLPVTDANGDPVTTTVSVSQVLYDGAWNPRRSVDGGFLTEQVTVVPWGYRTATGGIKDSGDVLVADYKISCPMLLTDIVSGTELLMTDYARTFRVRVLKMTTYNWGTNLWVNNVKN